MKKPKVPIETLRWACQTMRFYNEQYRKFFEKYFKEKSDENDN